MTNGDDEPVFPGDFRDLRRWKAQIGFQPGMPVVMIAAQSGGTGAAIGAAAVLIGISIVLVILVAPIQRKRFRSGRSARFRSADGVVREGTIVGFGKGRRIRVRDSDGTEYEVRATRISLL